MDIINYLKNIIDQISINSKSLKNTIDHTFIKSNDLTLANLPYDILNIIIKYCNCYNIIFVCKTLKNTIYTYCEKCDKCDKIVKINNEILWSTENYNICHTHKNVIIENNVELF